MKIVERPSAVGMRGLAVLVVLGLATTGGALELAGWSPLVAVRALRSDLKDLQIAAGMVHAPCPQGGFVILALGQSNAANHVGSPLPPNQAADAYVFFRDRCAKIGDPVPGATDVRGSLWTLLAQRLSMRIERPITVIAGAVSNTSVLQWRDDFGGIRARVERSIVAADAAGLPLDTVVWIQGENDAGALGAEAYADALLAVIGSIDAASPAASPDWIVTLTSKCGPGTGGDENIRTGQRRVIAQLARAHLGPDTDSFGNSLRSDGCHFNDAGRERIVADLIDQLAAIAKPEAPRQKPPAKGLLQ